MAQTGNCANVQQTRRCSMCPETTADQDSDTTSERRNFIIKTYCILLLEVAITALVMNYYFKHPEAIASVENQIYFWSLLTILLLFILVVIQSFLPMIAFCICDGVLLSVFASAYETQLFIAATAITIGLFCFLTYLALFSTGAVCIRRGYVMIIFLVFITLLILTITNVISSLQIIVGVIGACVFSLFILYDTDMLLNGFYQIQMTREGYMYPAISLYVDAVCLLVTIAYLCGYIAGGGDNGDLILC